MDGRKDGHGQTSNIKLVYRAIINGWRCVKMDLSVICAL